VAQDVYIYNRTNADGTVDYIAQLGTILYNERLLSLGSLNIPLREQSFFSIPEDRGKYAVVNVYYTVETGEFVFDRVALTTKYIQQATASVKDNVLPVCQFVLKQSLASFDVMRVNEYARMATFTITESFETGLQGLQGPLGHTGFLGHTGIQAVTGLDGYVGSTGMSGITGVGSGGATGAQGCTGGAPDSTLLFYMKFKADDPVSTDYSDYARDCIWSVTGVGITGGNEISTRNTEVGIVDNCTQVFYNGGMSSFTRDDYLDFCGFTGTIQVWARFDVPPVADFVYTFETGIPNRYVFTDASRYFADTWVWTVDGTVSSHGRVFEKFFPTGMAGEHIIKLVSGNDVGSTEKHKVITSY